MLNIKKFVLSTVAVICLLGFASFTNAGVIPVSGGYEVSYEIDMNSGSSNGSDIESVFIFEWDDTSFTNFSAMPGGDIAGTGITYLSHVIDFEPTFALIMGYGAGILGVGDEKDHVYTVTNSSFADSVLGIKWSVVFPGVTPETRFRHSAMVELLADAALNGGDALDALIYFVTTEGYQAAFDPAAEGFEVVEWSCGGEPCPEVPEPATFTLFVLGLVGLGWSRRKKI